MLSRVYVANQSARKTISTGLVYAKENYHLILSKVRNGKIIVFNFKRTMHLFFCSFDSAGDKVVALLAGRGKKFKIYFV